jgi:hypothetical protein
MLNIIPSTIQLPTTTTLVVAAAVAAATTTATTSLLETKQFIIWVLLIFDNHDDFKKYVESNVKSIYPPKGIVQLCSTNQYLWTTILVSFFATIYDVK